MHRSNNETFHTLPSVGSESASTALLARQEADAYQDNNSQEGHPNV